jgi:phosphohistidine phosphatase
MELFLIRHAIAEDGEDDDARPLSPKGIKKFKDTAAALRLMEIRFDRIFHSPKLRAAQTADLLETLLDGKMEQTPLLAAAPTPAMFEQLANSGNVVAVVGHEPWLSSLLAWLVTGEAALGAAFELKKGSVARLEGAPTPAGMRLRALLPPSTMRRMGLG